MLVTLTVLIAGCGRPVNRFAERRLRDMLTRYVGPAKEWRAHVNNPAGETIRGSLSHIIIDGDQVVIQKTVPCDKLHLDVKDARLDPFSGKIKSVGSCVIHAEITENAVNDYLLSVPPSADSRISIKKVQLRQGKLIVSAGYHLLGQIVPFTAAVEPRLSDPTTLKLDPERISVLGLHIPLPVSALRYVAHYFDPVFDFSGLPFPVKITGFQVADGRLSIDGTADIVQFMNRIIR